MAGKVMLITHTTRLRRRLCILAVFAKYPSGGAEECCIEVARWRRSSCRSVLWSDGNIQCHNAEAKDRTKKSFRRGGSGKERDEDAQSKFE